MLQKFLCSFILVLEEKTSKKIPESSRLESLVKFSANTFALSDAEDNTSGTLNRGGIADGNSPNVLRAKLLESDGLFCFISIFNFGSSKNPFTIITSLPQLYFRFRRFILLVQMKKVISMNYGSSTSS